MMTSLKGSIGMLIFLPALVAFFGRFSTTGDLIAKLEDYLAYYIPEKIYLHTDKAYYAAGDTIWLAAYLTHGVSHMAIAPSKIVYVELVNEQKEVLARRDIGIAAGTGSAEFALADTLAGGTYLLRGYTSLMRNFGNEWFFRKEVAVAGQLAGSDSLAFAQAPSSERAPLDHQLSELLAVDFFPEGGDLVEGLWSTVGVKVISPGGKGVEVSGEIWNGDGKKVADFETGEMGMGRFRLFPETGQTYKAIVRLGKRSIEEQLPPVRRQGYVLTVSNLSGENLAVKVDGNEPIRGGYLIAHIRGSVFLTLLATDDWLEAIVPKSGLPEGIATFTWFDRENRPQCERLVFIENGKMPEMSIGGLKPQYSKREKVDLELLSAGGAVMSVAVTDKAKIHHKAGGENVRSYLLLNSDLRGAIENPGYYFDPANRTRLQDLDNLLLTQGWRRFSWRDIQAGKKPEIAHLAEPDGFTVAGRVVDFYNQKKPVECTITLTATSKAGDFLLEETQTDSLGNFSFRGLSFADSARVVLQTPNEKKLAKKGEKKDFIEGGEVNLPTKILLTGFVSPEVDFKFEQVDEVEANQFFEQYLSELKRVQEIDAAFSLGRDVQVLEEIEVRDFRFRERERFDRPGMLYTRPTRRIDADSIVKLLLPQSPLDIIQFAKVNGLRTTGFGSSMNLSSRNGSPLYILDGMELDSEQLWLINSIPPATIDFIDILQGPEAAVYQVLFAVLIYTKREASYRKDYNFVGVQGATHPGFYHAREFYSPDYSSKRESHVRTDVRPTLYWKGGLKATAEAPAKLEFYTSDVASAFEVRIEGITEDGRPFVKREEFVVN